jgi:hypothetical protein
MDNNNAAASALKQIDRDRRGFIGMLLTGGAAVVGLPAMSTIVLGDDQQSAGKCKGGGGKGKGGKRDLANRAEEMIKAFDKDGDGALNVKELTAALTAKVEQRAARQGKGKG